MREVKDRSEPNVKVTPAPPHDPSATPIEHRLFLRALQGLGEGEAIRLYCHDSEDVSLLVEETRSFIHRGHRKGRLSHRFSVLKSEERKSLVVYVVKGGNQGK